MVSEKTRLKYFPDKLKRGFRVKTSTALIILGMHRSGTSLLSGLLSQVGVVMGKRLYAPQTGVNEKGFWEHEDIVDTHDELLLTLNSQWDDVLPLPDKWWENRTVQPFVGPFERLSSKEIFQMPPSGRSKIPGCAECYLCGFLFWLANRLALFLFV